MFIGRKAKLIVLMLGMYLYASFVMQPSASGQLSHPVNIDSLLTVADSLLISTESLLVENDSLSLNDITSLLVDSLALPSGLPVSEVNEILESFDPFSSENLLLLPEDELLSLSSDSIFPMPDDSIPKKKGMLDHPVIYEAKDSLVLTADNFAYLFGEGNVKYDKIELEAEFIEMNMDNNTIFAKFDTDSLGVEFGYPLFKEDDSQYDSKTLRYNFKTRKGYITDAITTQGEGFLTAKETKKLENDDLFIKGGRYTTCDEHEHPHFYLQLTKARVRPKKSVVSGPAYLVVEDVPLPLALPFGFFPFTDTYSSGIIMPSFGDEMRRGFFARNGGYYFAMSQYIDLALTGEIYTKGSWGLQGRSRYIKRYKFSGNVDINYLVTILGDKGLPDYSKSKDFKIMWSHAQDAKANPFRTLSASVNMSTQSYDRQSINSIYNDASTQNTKGSTINYTQRFANTPFNFSTSMSVNQSSRDGNLTLTLPDLNLNYPRFYPLQRKKSAGKQQWYEKISVSYTGRLSNQYRGKGDQFFKASLLKDWDNYMTHSIPVSATYTLFKYLNVTPNFKYDERWQTDKVTQSYNIMDQSVQRDTTYGFHRTYNYNTAISFETKLYGFFKPLPFLGKKVDMIRHVLTPNVSLGYTPDFRNPKYGFWGSSATVNGDGSITTTGYSRYPGTSPSSLQGMVTFGVKNNVEAKILASKDSVFYKNISLIDDLGASWGYNMAADSMKWNESISGNIRLKLTKSYALTLTGQFDPYTYQVRDNGNESFTPYKVNVLRCRAGKGFARLKNTSTSFSYTFDNSTFNKWFGKNKDKSKNTSESLASGIQEGGSDEDNNFMTSDQDIMDPGIGLVPRSEDGENSKGGRARDKKTSTEGDYDEEGYMKSQVKWSFQVNYGLQFVTLSEFDFKILEYKRGLKHTFDFSGTLSPAKSWNFSFQSSYDFAAKTISYLRGSISKDLHCFEIVAGVIPFGPMQSYNVTIRAKSAMLGDLLKYKKQNMGYDKVEWY